MNNPYRFGDRAINNLQTLSTSDINQIAKDYNFASEAMTQIAHQSAQLAKAISNDASEMYADENYTNAILAINERANSGKLTGKELIQETRDSLLPKVLEETPNHLRRKIASDIMKQTVQAGLQLQNRMLQREQEEIQSYNTAKMDAYQDEILNNPNIVDANADSIVKEMHTLRKELMPHLSDAEHDLYNDRLVKSIIIHQTIQPKGDGSFENLGQITRLLRDPEYRTEAIAVMSRYNEEQRLFQDAIKAREEVAIKEQVESFVSTLPGGEEQLAGIRTQNTAESVIKFSQELDRAFANDEVDYYKSLKMKGQQLGYLDMQLSPEQYNKSRSFAYQGGFTSEGEIEDLRASYRITGSVADAFLDGFRSRNKSLVAVDEKLKAEMNAELGDGLQMKNFNSEPFGGFPVGADLTEIKQFKGDQDVRFSKFLLYQEIVGAVNKIQYSSAEAYEKALWEAKDRIYKNKDAKGTTDARELIANEGKGVKPVASNTPGLNIKENLKRNATKVATTVARGISEKISKKPNKLEVDNE